MSQTTASIYFGILLLVTTLVVSGTAFAEDFDKPGNNGSASCSRFCSNDGSRGWGRAGTCVSGTVIGTGASVGCGIAPGSPVMCRCSAPPGPPPGAFEKGGNNGSATCTEYCSNRSRGGVPTNWGPLGTCVGGRVEYGPRGGTAIGCEDAPGVGNDLTCYCAPPNLSSGPPAGAVEKGGNNGTATCANYCRNNGGPWGPAGTCVGGRYSDGPMNGTPISCDVAPGLGNHLVCYCRPPPGPPPGAFEKGGNNGTASCAQYCSNTGNDGRPVNWGRLGTCVGGRSENGPGGGSEIACNNAPGLGNDLICYCGPPGPPPEPPQGAFVKAGNNGTASCANYCSNNGADWGRSGDCVGGRLAAGPRAGAGAECNLVPGMGNDLECFCRPAAEPPQGSFVKDGDNGTASCADYCMNRGGNWGSTGVCVGGRFSGGRRRGASVACDQVPGAGNPMQCYCEPAPMHSCATPPSCTTSASSMCSVTCRADREHANCTCTYSGPYRIPSGECRCEPGPPPQPVDPPPAISRPPHLQCSGVTPNLVRCPRDQRCCRCPQVVASCTSDGMVMCGWCHP
ncbi:MAG: peptidase [Myxococcaceae bacterium]|nr:peptidase [Myxococcaceae bacterium]